MSKQTTTDFEVVLEDILQRWFKNPPFPLPEWVDKDFMRGITKAQQIEIKFAVSELVEECLPINGIPLGESAEVSSSRGVFMAQSFIHLTEEQKYLIKYIRQRFRERGITIK